MSQKGQARVIRSGAEIQKIRVIRSRAILAGGLQIAPEHVATLSDWWTRLNADGLARLSSYSGLPFCPSQTSPQLPFTHQALVPAATGSAAQAVPVATRELRRHPTVASP